MTAAVSLAKREPLSGRKLDARKDSLLHQLRRKGGDSASFRCRHCGGRIDVYLRLDAHLKEIGSRGECRTPGCITWSD